MPAMSKIVLGLCAVEALNTQMENQVKQPLLHRGNVATKFDRTIAITFTNLHLDQNELCDSYINAVQPNHNYEHEQEKRQAQLDELNATFQVGEDLPEDMTVDEFKTLMGKKLSSGETLPKLFSTTEIEGRKLRKQLAKIVGAQTLALEEAQPRFNCLESAIENFGTQLVNQIEHRVVREFYEQELKVIIKMISEKKVESTADRALLDETEMTTAFDM